MKNQEPKLSPRRKRFNEKYNESNEIEIQKELLFTQQLTAERIEKVRANTSTLVWFLIVIPIIFGILLGMS